MPLTQGQGLLLSNDELMAGIVESSPLVVQLSHRLPFFEVDGDSERWANPNAALPNAMPVGYGGPVPDQTTIPMARAYTFGEIGTGREVNFATHDLQSNVNDQAAVQLDMGRRNILYEFWRQFNYGDPINPGEFRGLDSIIAQPAFAGQIVDALGSPPTTLLLDRALRLIGQGEGYADAIYTGQPGYNAIREAFFARGELPQPEFIEVPDGNGGIRPMAVTHVDGVPVFWTDIIQTEEFDGLKVMRIWFLKFGPRHVHGIVPGSIGNRTLLRKTEIPGVSRTRYDLTLASAISVPSVKDISVIINAAI